MYILMHSNCDSSCGSVWGKWKHDPTAEDLTKELSGYCDEDKLNEIVEELIAHNECDVDNGDCTHYEIQEI